MLEWIDPTKGYPSQELAEGVTPIGGGSRYVAVSQQFVHKSLSARDIIHTSGLGRVDDRDWELFVVQRESADHSWGQFVEGLGLMDVMVLKSTIRDLTDEERAYFSGRGMIMYGNHSGKASYSFALPTL